MKHMVYEDQEFWGFADALISEVVDQLDDDEVAEAEWCEIPE